MSQVQGTDFTGDYHHGNPPWSEQKRAVPLRTYSGSVVYKRNPHVWHMKDVERIAKKVEIDVDDRDPDWLYTALQKIKDVTLLMLGKILPFLDDDMIRSLYDFVYILLGKIFNVDTDYMLSNRNEAESIIYALASKFRLDVTIKRLP